MKKNFLFAFLFGLSIFIFYQSFISMYDRALADADEILAERAQTIADAIDRTLQQRMVQVFTFAALPSMRGFAASDAEGRDARRVVAYNELHSITRADPDVRAALIVDVLGHVVLTTDASLNANWGARPFVRDALAGRLHASVTIFEFDELSQFYSAPILDNRGEVAGALVLRVATQEWWSALGGKNDVMVVDELGVRIADRFAKPLLFTALAPLTNDVATRALVENRYGAQVTQVATTAQKDLADAVTRGEFQSISFIDSAGQSYRAVIRRTKTNPWVVIAAMPEDAVFAPVRDAIIEQLKNVTIVLILAGILIFAVRARSNAKT